MIDFKKYLKDAVAMAAVQLGGSAIVLGAKNVGKRVLDQMAIAQGRKDAAAVDGFAGPTSKQSDDTSDASKGE